MESGIERRLTNQRHARVSPSYSAMQLSPQLHLDLLEASAAIANIE